MRVTRRALLWGGGRAVALPLWSSLLRATTVNRFPYVQNVTTSTATIVWTTEESGEGSVTWSRNPGLTPGQVVRAQTREYLPAETGMSRSFFQYRVDLAGLEPATDYYYVARRGSDNLSPGASIPFRTAPGAGASFRFLAFGDSGLGSPEQHLLATRMKAEESVSLVIHTGDIVYPVATFEGFDKLYFGAYRSLMESVPFYACLGNHDVEGDQGRSYLASTVNPPSRVPPPWTGRYYSFDWGDVHFVCLDTNLMTDRTAAAAMIEWVSRDLAVTRHAWRVVFFHHTPYDILRGEDAEQVAIRAQLLPVLEQRGVQLVLAGHHHAYMRTHSVLGGQRVADGVGTVYLTTGGGGAALYSEVTHPLNAAGVMEHHYVRGEVRGSEMILTAITKDGRTLDRFTISPKPVIPTAAVVDGATFGPALAPGGITTIFGHNLAFQFDVSRRTPLPRELAQVKVSFNGEPLPIYFVSPSQINVQLPYSSLGQGMLRVELGPGRDTQVGVRVSEAAPGIFMVHDGQDMVAAVVKPNGSLASSGNRAIPGEFISVYAAGLGRVEGPIQAGEVAPRSPLFRAAHSVTVRIGDTITRPVFAGLAPDFIGVYQVNVQVPSHLEPGDYSLTLRVGSNNSNVVVLPVG